MSELRQAPTTFDWIIYIEKTAMFISELGGGNYMTQNMFFHVGKDLCAECALALRRFIGHIKGVESIDVDEGNIVITFNDLEINAEELKRIVKYSIERLGYKLTE